VPRNFIPRNINSFTELNNFLSQFFKFTNELCKIKTGTYTGTGVALEVFTEFTPVLVVVTDLGSGTPVFWHNAFTSTNSKQFNSGTITTGITGVSVNRNGFAIGTHGSVNTNTTVYFYVAIGR